MNILVLGGTRLVGRGFVEAALARGHTLTLFNRGQTHADRFPEVERLTGDRDGDLSALGSRTWDAVFDPSASQPHRVSASLAALRDRVGFYLYVSSVSVYAGPEARDESSPLAQWDGRSEAVNERNYGGYKARCEALVEDAMPGRSAALRLGLVVGPYDESGRYNVIVRRMARGGEVLAAGPRDAPVQLIDGRDAGAFAVGLLERGGGGPYNVTGPTLSMERALAETRAGVGSDARLVWADHAWLVAQELQPWEDIPLWTAPEDQWMWRVSSGRAEAAGLVCRPLSESARDALAWEQGREAPTPERLDPESERVILARLRAEGQER